MQRFDLKRFRVDRKRNKTYFKREIGYIAV